MRLVHKINIMPNENTEICFYNEKLTVVGYNKKGKSKLGERVTVYDFTKYYKELVLQYTLYLDVYEPLNNIYQVKCNEMQNSVHLILSELVRDRYHKDPTLLTLNLSNFGRGFSQKFSTLTNLRLKNDEEVLFNSNMDLSYFSTNNKVLDNASGTKKIFKVQGAEISMLIPDNEDLQEFKFKLYQYSKLNPGYKVSSNDLTVKFVDFK